MKIRSSPNRSRGRYARRGFESPLGLRLIGWVAIAATLSAAGCPTTNSDSTRPAADPVAIVAGDYSGTQSCTTAVRPTGTRGSLFQQTSENDLAVSVDVAAKKLLVGGSAVTPGLVVNGATADTTVAQVIESVDFSATTIVVRYQATISFSSDGQQLTFSGPGEYSISGLSESELTYTESITLAFDDVDAGFVATLDCNGTLKR